MVWCQGTYAVSNISKLHSKRHAVPSPRKGVNLIGVHADNHMFETVSQGDSTSYAFFHRLHNKQLGFPNPPNPYMKGSDLLNHSS